MKLALVLYGQPRNYKAGYQALREFLDYQPAVVDVFYHCWTLEKPGEVYEASPWRTLTKENLTYHDDSIEELKQLYKPVKCLAEPALKDFDETFYKTTLAYVNIQGNERKRGNVKNVISQMISRTKARNLLYEHIEETKTNYTFVIMSRFDIRETPKNISIETLDPKKVYVSNAHLPRKVFPDNFIISPPKVFCQWMAIQNHLPTVLNSPELDKQLRGLKEKLELNPEEILLATYLWHFGSLQNLVTHPVIKCGI